MKLTIENYCERAAHKDKFPGGWAEFATYKPDITQIKKQFEPYEKYKNYIVTGNGGSISSLVGFWGAFAHQSKKNLEIVSTMEPDYLHDVMNRYHQKDTLVIAISKSGTTVGVIESLVYFKNYPVLVITSIGEGTLSAMAQEMGWEKIEHPAIGGRFTGRTAVAYGPARLLGIDIAGIEKGAAAAVEKNTKMDGPAWRVAKFLYDCDTSGGRNEVFLPVYSKFLIGFNHLITQLIHESDAKEGKGLSIIAAEAPESQHHTNQRFFGGPKNMVGIFVTVAKSHQKIKIEVPEKIKNITLRGGTVDDLNNSDLHHSLLCEAKGTMGDAKEQGIPYINIELGEITPEAIGEYMVFWQFVAYYCALLRGINPLDQPQVERSKELALNFRSK